MDHLYVIVSHDDYNSDYPNGVTMLDVWDVRSDGVDTDADAGPVFTSQYNGRDLYGIKHGTYYGTDERLPPAVRHVLQLVAPFSA